MNAEFVRACTLAELSAKGRLVVHGSHRPILVVHDRGRVFALDDRCPHMGFPLDRGSVEDGIRRNPVVLDRPTGSNPYPGSRTR